MGHQANVYSSFKALPDDKLIGKNSGFDVKRLSVGEKVKVLARYKVNQLPGSKYGADRYLITSKSIRRRFNGGYGLDQLEYDELAEGKGLVWINVADVDILKDEKCDY